MEVLQGTTFKFREGAIYSDVGAGKIMLFENADFSIRETKLVKGNVNLR